VDLAAALSKLAPQLARTAAMHRQIGRRGKKSVPSQAARVRHRTRLSDAVLLAAEIRYEAGATLREIAPDLSVSRQRLASLLRARGVKWRRMTPSLWKVGEMVRKYESGESLDRVGSRLGFSAGTVRNHLLAAGTVMRDTHGRYPIVVS
jgi:predicted transcriptional regulator